MSLSYRKFAILLALCVGTACSDLPAENRERVTREFTYSAPIYYDSTSTPVSTQSAQPQQGLQSIPILGALVSNVPGLNGITSSLSTLVPLGNLGGLMNLGGIVPGLGLPQSQQSQCPLGQISRCRCENLIQVTQRKQRDALEIVQQNVKLNANGQREITARLSNGLQLYQRTGSEVLPPNNQPSNVIQGYYTLQVNNDKYLTIYYIITDTDYTVKADVTPEPPKSALDESPQMPEM